MKNNRKITKKYTFLAYYFKVVYPVLRMIFWSSPKLEFATKKIARLKIVTIPTRHGDIKAIIFSPTATDIKKQQDRGETPPVHMIAHGGAFVLQRVHDEDNVARYLASEVGCYVVVPKYDSAPKVQYPVSEEQLYDSFLWIQKNADKYNWDKKRISVGGSSAGGYFAVCVALMALELGDFIPIAISTEFGVFDISIPNDERTSPKKLPLINNSIINLAIKTYFKGIDRKKIAPNYHPHLHKMPPILVLVGALDTLYKDGKLFAKQLKDLGAKVTYIEFHNSDHNFTHSRPFDTANVAISTIGNHLKTAYQSAHD